MATPAATPANVLESKLRPPRQRPELFMRERLLDELDRLDSCALTLVAAPVGFGKTVLAQSWCARTSTPVAWVSLDAADDDPARLWTYIATAVDRIRDGLGRTALARLRSPGVAPEVVVDELLKGISAYEAPLAIVLDDLHTVTNPECLESLESAIERLPENGRIVVTTRADPPVALGRLRGRGALGEIRARELAFDADETRLVLERDGIVLDDDAVELLVGRTEGWPAGVYLAALWLRTLDDPNAGVEDFTGDHRHVVDYLSSEILEALDTDTRTFLVDTAVLDRFTPSMCDAVLQRGDSASMISRLESSNAFVVALDPRGEWFRYHHLFGEVLRMELAGDADRSTRLHARACRWCRDHGLLEDALEHAAAAKEWETVADLLLENHLALVISRPATFLRWCDLLPDSLLLAQPLLAVAGVMATRHTRRSATERGRFLAIAQRGRSECPEEWTAYHEVGLHLSSIGWIEVGLGDSASAAAEALALARGGVAQLMVPALAGAGIASFLAGDLDSSQTLAREAVEYPSAESQPHGFVIALALLGLIERETTAGTGVETARQALREAVRLGVDESPTGGFAHIAMAQCLVSAGRAREAEREALEGVRLRRQASPELIHAYAMLTLAHVRARRGLVDLAEADLATARATLSCFTDIGRLGDLAANVEKEIRRGRDGATADYEPLSGAELAVLRLFSSDLTQREIASSLFVSVNTVKTHARLIYRKLGVGSRADAVARAHAIGVIGSDDSPG